MCQIAPFTLPCCRRVYVLAKKISTCPDEWPKKKCPAELCLQVGSQDPSLVEQRSEGTCWRCLAHWDRKTGEERERMRPTIDRAELVEGLEETTPLERRRRVEASGICWFCMGEPTSHGCDMCEVHPESSRYSYTSMRPPPAKVSRRVEKRPQLSSNTPNKRPKLENFYSGGSMVSHTGLRDGGAGNDIASPFHTPYDLKNNPVDPFVDSPRQLPSQIIFSHPQNDGLASTNPPNEHSTPQEYQKNTNSHDYGYSNNTPNYGMHQPQDNTNRPGGYLEPYQTQNWNSINSGSLSQQENRPGSSFSCPRSGDKLGNQQKAQSRGKYSKLSGSPINPLTRYLEELRKQRGLQNDPEVPNGQWSLMNADPRSSNQPPPSEMQFQPSVRDFAETPSQAQHIDPQLLSFSHAQEESSQYLSGTLPGDSEYPSKVEEPYQHYQDHGYLNSSSQTAYLQAKTGSPGKQIETDTKNEGTSTYDARPSETSQSHLPPQSEEYGNDSYSQDLFGTCMSDAEFSRLLNEYDNRPSTS